MWMLRLTRSRFFFKVSLALFGLLIFSLGFETHARALAPAPERGDYEEAPIVKGPGPDRGAYKEVQENTVDKKPQSQPVSAPGPNSARGKQLPDPDRGNYELGPEPDRGDYDDDDKKKKETKKKETKKKKSKDNNKTSPKKGPAPDRGNYREGKCGGEKGPAPDRGNYREGKCGEGKCGKDKGGKDKCGADSAMPERGGYEGRCGEGKSGKGKGGEGKCGGAKSDSGSYNYNTVNSFPEPSGPTNDAGVYTDGERVYRISDEQPEGMPAPDTGSYDPPPPPPPSPPARPTLAPGD